MNGSGHNIDNFKYDSGIAAERRAKLDEQHRRAHDQISSCQNLTDEERTSLFKAYNRIIVHHTLDDPSANAAAFVNGSELFVNFDVLFPQGNDEIAQSLIHEMMHCAGLVHPNRSASDIPGDGGPYYSSPPLRAELCIAGLQSDAACVADAEGRYSIQKRK